MTKPNIEATKKLISISYKVTEICSTKSLLLKRFIIVENTFEGEEYRNELIISYFDSNSQMIRKDTKTNI